MGIVLGQIVGHAGQPRMHVPTAQVRRADHLAAGRLEAIHHQGGLVVRVGLQSGQAGQEGGNLLFG